LGKKQKDWVKCSWSPKSNPSLKIFVEEFLKGWGPKSQSFEDTYQDLLAALQEKRFLGFLEVDEAANSTGYYEEPVPVSSFITSFVDVKEEIYDDSSENSIGCNVSSSDEDFEGYYDHDDTVAKEDSLKGLSLIASSNNGIGEQSAAILDREDEGLLHLLKNDMGTR
jgi:hypothetical protein